MERPWRWSTPIPLLIDKEIDKLSACTNYNFIETNDHDYKHEKKVWNCIIRSLRNSNSSNCLFFFENRRDELFRGPNLKLILATSVYLVLDFVECCMLIIYIPPTEWSRYSSHSKSNTQIYWALLCVRLSILLKVSHLSSLRSLCGGLPW